MIVRRLCSLVRPRAVDHFFERDIFLALGAADQAHLLEIVLGLEHVALFGMPHAVIGPGQSVLRIGGERLVVPVFGVVITAELAVGIAEQGRHVGIVVVLQGAQGGDAGLIVVLVINQGVSGMIALDEILGRTALVVFLLLLARLAAGRLAGAAAGVTGAAAAHRGSELRGARNGRCKDDGGKERGLAHDSSGYGCESSVSCDVGPYLGCLSL